MKRFLLLALTAGLITYCSIKGKNGNLKVNYDSRETALAACLKQAEQWTDKELLNPDTFLKNSDGDFKILEYTCYPAAEKGYVGLYIPKVKYLILPTNDGWGTHSLETVIATPVVDTEEEYEGVFDKYTWERDTNKRSLVETFGTNIKVQKNK